ncbi:hypothetical protein D3C71_1437900 [compost metagenome]
MTRLSSDQLACWSKSTTVLRPTLKVSQLRMALSPVWAMLTVVVPSLLLWVGALALNQPRVRASSSIFSPPSPSPSGTWPARSRAASRAVCCMRCCMAIACAAVLRFSSDVLSVSRACWAC